MKSKLSAALIACMFFISAFSQSKVTLPAPDVLVKNLYNASKYGRSPFFQTKSKQLLYSYFTKDFADLIWKDAVTSKGEVGIIDFDPLYNAQDTQIKNFKIGKPEYGEGNMKLADVPVTFRNMGHKQTILFRTEDTGRGVWRISDIFYPDNEDGSPSLKSLLQQYGTKQKKH